MPDEKKPKPATPDYPGRKVFNAEAPDHGRGETLTPKPGTGQPPAKPDSVKTTDNTRVVKENRDTT